MRLIARLLACAVLLGGCTTPSPSVPATTDAGLTTAAPSTATAEASISTDFTSSELCPGGTGNTCRLAAGEHHSLGFGDGIAFAINGSWIVRANETDLISLEAGDASNPQVVELITGALRFSDPTTYALSPVTDASTAQRLLAAITNRGFSRTTVTERPSTALGGAPAVVFDVNSTNGSTLFSYPVTEHASTLRTGRTARFIWSTWAGAPFIVSIESDARTFDAFVESVQPMLASLEFGDED